MPQTKRVRELSLDLNAMPSPPATTAAVSAATPPQDAPNKTKATTDSPIDAPESPDMMQIDSSSPTSYSRASPAMDTPTMPKANKAKGSQPKQKGSKYQSSLKKLKKAMSEHPYLMIDTIDELRTFIANNDVMDPSVRAAVRIQARLLWTVTDNTKGLHFLWLYLSEAQAPEPLEQQQKEYQAAQRQDPFNVNQYLITTFLYEVDAENPRSPCLGAVIAFTASKLRLNRNCCQVDSKLVNISVVDEAQ